MNDMRCEKWREAIAIRLFGDLSTNEEAALVAHLEGCADCETIAREFAQTYRMLSYVDPAAVAPTASVPAKLTNKVLRDLQRGAAQHRRRRRTRVTSLAGVGLIAASFLFALAFFGPKPTTPPPPQHA